MPLVFSLIEIKRAGASVNRRENTRFPLNRPNPAVSAILASSGTGPLLQTSLGLHKNFDILQMVNPSADYTLVALFWRRNVARENGRGP
jgi:hypothetical protein